MTAAQEEDLAECGVDVDARSGSDFMWRCAMDLATAVIEVMRTAMHGKNTEPGWVTAYQVLNRLPEALRAELVRDTGGYGGRANDADRGTGAANAVMRVLRDLGFDLDLAIELPTERARHVDVGRQ